MKERTEKAVSGFLAAIGGAVGLALYLIFAPALPAERKHLEPTLATSSAGLGAGAFGLASLFLPSAASGRRRRLREKEAEAQRLGEECDKKRESLRLAQEVASSFEGDPVSNLLNAKLPEYDYQLNPLVVSYSAEEDVILDAREREAERASREARKMLHAIDARLQILRVAFLAKGGMPIDEIVAPSDPSKSSKRKVLEDSRSL